MLHYEKDKHYFKQYPIENRYVVDFAFPEERVIIEIDGKDHGKKLANDIIRDDFMHRYKWAIIRIPEVEFDKNPSFYKSLVYQVIEARRENPDYKLIKNKHGRAKIYTHMGVR